MNEISCNVCMDLIPLVKDGVASDDSCLLVEEHIINCSTCKSIYMSEIQIELQMDDKVVVGKIKKQITYFLFVFLLIGAVFGMMITDSMDMFYNALIMPMIGGIGYVLLKKKSYVLPFSLFGFCTVWTVVKEILSGNLSYGSSVQDILIQSIFYSTIYAFFSIIGIVIAWLLTYAFRRESNEKN